MDVGQREYLTPQPRFTPLTSSKRKYVGEWDNQGKWFCDFLSTGKTGRKSEGIPFPQKHPVETSVPTISTDISLCSTKMESAPGILKMKA